MPNSAAALKQQIESQLARRIPAALSPMAPLKAVRQPFSDARLNELLSGGVPPGAITEVYGSVCSGRTSFALSLASALTAAGSVAAWVDVSDALDPESASLCGVELDRLLWVRCGSADSQSVDLTSATDQHAMQQDPLAAAVEPNLVATNYLPKPVGNGGCGSPHPRGEGKGMAEAIDSLLQAQPRSAAMKQRRERKIIGTPGAPNRDVTNLVETTQKDVSTRHSTTNIVLPDEMEATRGALYGRQVERKVSCGSNWSQPSSSPRSPMPFPNASPYREEQIPTDRQPARRAVQHSGNVGPKTKPRVDLRELNAPVASQRRANMEQDSWGPLDQALRATDLLLQAGGFSLLVLDLGDVPANMAWRIPLATWFRFRAACERSRTILLVMSQHPCARASADLTVAMEFSSAQSDGGTVATGSRFRLHVEQQRRGMSAQPEPAIRTIPFHKPVRSDSGSHLGGTWTAGAPWSIRA